MPSARCTVGSQWLSVSTSASVGLYRIMPAAPPCLDVVALLDPRDVAAALAGDDLAGERRRPAAGCRTAGCCTRRRRGQHDRRRRRRPPVIEAPVERQPCVAVGRAASASTRTRGSGSTRPPWSPTGDRWFAVPAPGPCCRPTRRRTRRPRRRRGTPAPPGRCTGRCRREIEKLITLTPSRIACPTAAAESERSSPSRRRPCTPTPRRPARRRCSGPRSTPNTGADRDQLPAAVDAVWVPWPSESRAVPVLLAVGWRVVRYVDRNAAPPIELAVAAEQRRRPGSSGLSPKSQVRGRAVGLRRRGRQVAAVGERRVLRPDAAVEHADDDALAGVRRCRRAPGRRRAAPMKSVLASVSGWRSASRLHGDHAGDRRAVARPCWPAARWRRRRRRCAALADLRARHLLVQLAEELVLDGRRCSPRTLLGVLAGKRLTGDGRAGRRRSPRSRRLGRDRVVVELDRIDTGCCRCGRAADRVGLRPSGSSGCSPWSPDPD